MKKKGFDEEELSDKEQQMLEKELAKINKEVEQEHSEIQRKARWFGPFKKIAYSAMATKKITEQFEADIFKATPKVRDIYIMFVSDKAINEDIVPNFNLKPFKSSHIGNGGIFLIFNIPETEGEDVARIVQKNIAKDYLAIMIKANRLRSRENIIITCDNVIPFNFKNQDIKTVIAKEDIPLTSNTEHLIGLINETIKEIDFHLPTAN